jgi:PIN domain nuclease of toxin-antitoxin system
VLLWWLEDSPELSEDLKDRIDSELEVHVSAATVWELSIKTALGKLEIPDDLTEVLEQSGLSELPIRFHHAERAGRLPPVHRDPFDRMLIAQALTERLTLVTRDELIHKYEVPILKA